MKIIQYKYGYSEQFAKIIYKSIAHNVQDVIDYSPNSHVEDFIGNPLDEMTITFMWERIINSMKYKQ